MKLNIVLSSFRVGQGEVLILNPSSSLKVFTSCKNSLEESLGWLMYTIISSVNNDTFDFFLSTL